MPADADRRAHPARNRHPPVAVEQLVDVPELGAGLYPERGALRVERDTGHSGQVKQNFGVGVADEIGVAVAATADRQPFAGVDRLLHGLDDLRGRADQADGVRGRDPPLVDSPDQLRVSGIGCRDRHSRGDHAPGAGRAVGRRGIRLGRYGWRGGPDSHRRATDKYPPSADLTHFRRLHIWTGS